MQNCCSSTEGSDLEETFSKRIIVSYTNATSSTSSSYSLTPRNSSFRNRDLDQSRKKLIVIRRLKKTSLHDIKSYPEGRGTSPSRSDSPQREGHNKRKPKTIIGKLRPPIYKEIFVAKVKPSVDEATDIQDPNISCINSKFVCFTNSIV